MIQLLVPEQHCIHDNPEITDGKGFQRIHPYELDTASKLKRELLVV